ncbi:glycogen debranching N-terminal domain-containing protein [Microbispora sp. H10885]|uniref:amylo-alpha-1,6-glucosidase n=1 Tax=Microbispora sp. H10885 TaxID=2729110 RepID=UPI002175C14E|nr:glycogen debranching N-terminal domain-containing protein [Microbispora sp. H10885]
MTAALTGVRAGGIGMTGGWTFEGQPSPIGAGAVTLVAGGSFCVSSRNGDILPGAAQGIYYADTRLLSQWELRVDDGPIEELQVVTGEPYHATFLGRAAPRPGQVESTLLVTRDRYVGGGLSEDLVIRNMSHEPAGLVVTLLVGSDVCDLFEVKTHRVHWVADVTTATEERSLRMFSVSKARGARVTAEAGDTPVLAVPAPRMLLFRAVVPPRGEWRAALKVNPIINGVETEAWYCHKRLTPALAEQAGWLFEWDRSLPEVTTSNTALGAILRQSHQDIGALRLFDPERPDLPPSVAAGAPWFMTLFGRDSLLTSLLVLPLDPGLAYGTLCRLADLQGTKADPMTEEEPGKILHELRYGARPDDAGVGVGGHAYYGSVDSSPLFVVLLGELRRWGLDTEAAWRLLPHADAALEWIERYGMRDGFLWYRRKTDQGLVNQGWKDSFDGINFADGALARPPIALAEVQGYVYAAYLARHYFAREAGDAEAERHYRRRAAELRARFNERFWLPDRGYFAVGLDHEGRPIDALASNMGHCLWSGIVDRDKAASVAGHLLSPRMFTGFGIRTLASDMGAYNPMSYHNGSVWPHDSALAAAGLMRYGFVEEAQRVACGLLDAARAFGDRLPELFCGFDRGEFNLPVPYPTSCSPQAWSSAAPIQLVRLLLRIDPWVPHGKVWIAPALPAGFGDLRISGMHLAGTRVDLDVREGSGVPHVTGLPGDVLLISEPRPPASSRTGA